MRLAELIAQRREETGLTVSQAVERANTEGYGLNRQIIHWILRDELKDWPKVDTLRALSIAFDVPITDVIDATAESLGLAVKRAPEDDSTVRAWLALTQERTPEEIDHLLSAAKTAAAAIDYQPVQRNRRDSTE